MIMSRPCIVVPTLCGLLARTTSAHAEGKQSGSPAGADKGYHGRLGHYTPQGRHSPGQMVRG